MAKGDWMSEFEIVIGPMRAGKTTYCKSKTDSVFISYDDLVIPCWMCNLEFSKLANHVACRLKDNPNKNFIIDGWYSSYNKDPKTILTLKNLVPQHIKITVFYAPVELLLKRNDSAEVKNTIEEILRTYKDIIEWYKNELVDIDFEFRDSNNVYSFSEFMKRVRNDMLTASPLDVDTFLSYLSVQAHDRYYQSINLPFEKSIKGYERTELTWPIIEKTVNFRGKTMLDVGCYHAYTCFSAEDCGVKEVTGVDRCVQAIDIANKLKIMWNYKTDFVLADIDTWTPTKKYDIVICFNTIQYPTNTKEAVRKLFDAGDLVIFEAHEKFKPIFDDQNTHDLIRIEESPRWRDLKRLIYYYKHK